MFSKLMFEYAVGWDEAGCSIVLSRWGWGGGLRWSQNVHLNAMNDWPTAQATRDWAPMLQKKAFVPAV